MSLVKISGVGDVLGPLVEVDPAKAWSNFLVMVNLNMFSLKELLLSNSNITYGALRQWVTENGFDFNTLDLILTAK